MGKKSQKSYDFTPIGSKPKESITIEEIVTNPLACGYLLDFCEKSFCSENLRFWIAVDRYKDQCRYYKFSSSRDVKKCGAMLAFIWKEFFTDRTGKEITLCSKDRKETIDRMVNFRKNCEEVFDVALMDPMKTLREEIRPRFINSQQFVDLLSRETLLDTTVEYVPTNAPTGTILEFDLPENKTEFTLNEMLSDRYLFQELLDFQERRFTSENLLCVRHIQVFEELADTRADLVDRAFDIFMIFVRAGSKFEISMNQSTRKDVMLNLVNPTKYIFSSVKEEAMRTLKQEYKELRQSADYEKMVEVMKQQKKKLQNKENKIGFSFFPRR